MSDSEHIGTRARGPGRGASMTTAEAEAFRAGRAEGYAAGVQAWRVEVEARDARIAILANALNRVIFGDVNNPPDAANAVRIARAGLRDAFPRNQRALPKAPE